MTVPTSSIFKEFEGGRYCFSYQRSSIQNFDTEHNMVVVGPLQGQTLLFLGKKYLIEPLMWEKMWFPQKQFLMVFPENTYFCRQNRVMKKYSAANL